MGIGSGEGKCIDMKEEQGLHSEEEEKEDMDIQEEEDVEIKEEVRVRIECNILCSKGRSNLGDVYVFFLLFLCNVEGL
jgi:hypothetical protein